MLSYHVVWLHVLSGWVPVCYPSLFLEYPWVDLSTSQCVDTRAGQDRVWSQVTLTHTTLSPGHQQPSLHTSILENINSISWFYKYFENKHIMVTIEFVSVWYSSINQSEVILFYHHFFNDNSSLTSSWSRLPCPSLVSGVADQSVSKIFSVPAF